MIPEKTNSIFFTRRSVRNYIDKTIEKEKLDYIISAAMYAPSARNKRTWEFIVVDKKDILLSIEKVHPYAQMLKEAPACIVVCGNTEIDGGSGYWIQDCSAATENILLSAKEVGIASVWLGVTPVKERVEAIANLFSLPKHIVAFGIVSLGYSDKIIEMPDRFEESKIHYNKF